MTIKKQMKKACLLVVLFILFISTFSSVIAQENQQSIELKTDLPPEVENNHNKVNPGERPAILSFEIPENMIANPPRNISPEEDALSQKFMQAKETGDEKEMQRIQNELDKLTGSVSKEEPNSGEIKPASGELPVEDQRIANKICNGLNIKAITIQREQIGPSNKMWAVVVVGGGSGFTSPDTVRTYYSTNDGDNWALYSTGFFDKVNSDEIDAEIVQTSSEKYLYIACGITLANWKKVIGMQVIKITGAFAGSTQILSWPGEDFNSTRVKKYRPRITSDAAKYQYSGASIYLVCVEDSLDPKTFYGKSVQKVAKINNPYTVTPIITYKPSAFYYGAVSLDPYCDLAYYNGLIIVISSGIGDYFHIFPAHSNISTFTSLGYPNPWLGDTVNSRVQAYIASNGLIGPYAHLMIIDREISLSYEADIQYFKSTNSGRSWSTGYVDHSGANSFRADILERKNSVPGEFYVAYSQGPSITNDPGNVYYSKSTDGIWSLPVQMNQLPSGNIAFPRPCYLTSPGDQCYAIWSGFGVWGVNTDVYGSGGCSGPGMTLNLTMFIEGFYNAGSNSQVSDTITVELRNATSPYAVADVAEAVVSSNGSATLEFTNAASGNYYIAIKHRNSIETWSTNAIAFSQMTPVSYDFSTASSQAFGSNMIQVDASPIRFADFSGDVNQDGVIELSDLTDIYNAGINFATGYLNTDLDGNGIVDLSDLNIAYNNSINFVSSIRP